MAPRTALPDAADSKTRVLGALLVEEGTLRPRDLERALAAQRESGERLGAVIARLGVAGEDEVASTLARQLGLPFEAGPLRPGAEALRLVNAGFARRRRVLPLRLTGRSLLVAMEDPLDLSTVDDLQFQSGRRVAAAVATPSALQEGLRAAYASEVTDLARALPSGPDRTASAAKPEARYDDPTGAPVVRVVDLLLRRAVDAGASDLHVEHGPGELVVRERIDGVLQKVADLPVGARASVLSRIKVLAGMDISVKRRPQDGGLPFVHGGRSLSIRVSTLPAEGGEKAVLRFLDPRAVPANLSDLGFSPEDLSRVRALVGGGRGVVLTAGPTGSGKSSTLFGALGEVDRVASNVVTLEDPVEYHVPGVNQVQMNPASGLTFASALRSVLRQDPDVIMIGEIRDRETAEIAMAAAVTGHLVLSTVHTIDAPSGITRLLQMGVQPHLLAGGLSGIVAQRLIRRRCRRCDGHPAGCPACHHGYRGRIGVFQVLTITEGIRDAIARGAAGGELRRLAEEAGMATMAENARRKVSEGVTTLHEVARVLREDPGESLPCVRCGGSVPRDGRGCPYCGWCRVQACICGRVLRRGWRYCPECLRRAPPDP